MKLYLKWRQTKKPTGLGFREKDNECSKEWLVNTDQFLNKLNVMGWGFVDKKIMIRAAESAEQDQTARMCKLILLYTLRKMNS